MSMLFPLWIVSKVQHLSQNDNMLQMPIITPVASETWGVKESVASEADMPEWGSEDERGIDMEVMTAAADLAAGSDAVILETSSVCGYHRQNDQSTCVIVLGGRKLIWH